MNRSMSVRAAASPFAALAVVLAAASLAAGCRARDGVSQQSREETASEPLEAGVPAWTLVQQAAVDGEFGTVTDLEVAPDGSVLVADFMAQQIRRFAAGGRRLPPIGRRGSGPGEFRGMRDVALRGDTLFALDVQQQRVSAFHLRGDSARLAYILPLTRSGQIANYELLAPARGELLVQYTTPSTDANLERPHTVELRRAGRGGVSATPMLSFPDKQFLVVRDASFGFSVGAMPYGREPVLRLGSDDRLYYGRTDHLGVDIYDLSGRRVGGFTQARPAARIVRGELDGMMRAYEREGRIGRMKRRMLEIGLRQHQIPDTKLAYETFVLDDRGRIWLDPVRAEDRIVETPTGMTYATPAGAGLAPSHWWVLDAVGRLQATVSVPGNVTLKVVRGDRAYGLETTDAGVQRLVLYQVRR
ncbi:MAG TPA: hypothetical protein VGO40_24635 [Longimicrobium sp.]|jgi:hypothetical protein|nr:hypothetical protein [Longimicrobium sp.]